ncbi:hypothetical protein [Cereibacter changlensis]|uniref:hypothetical protein n=1 Tax=Cereibacter changlensis TaxID=402884 RepID=UPI0040341739
MAEAQDVGRLALRVEGDWWVAYHAAGGTMDGAVPLGSIAMAAVTGNPARKAGFLALMQEVLADRVEQDTGLRPQFTAPARAPEHERSGRA